MKNILISFNTYGCKFLEELIQIYGENFKYPKEILKSNKITDEFKNKYPKLFLN